MTPTSTGTPTPTPAAAPASPPPPVQAEPPRVGFLGVGWIGRQRMAALVAQGLVAAVGVADPDASARAAAAEAVPGTLAVSEPGELLAAGLDGLVIATPSALHADQAVAALEAGAAVFCQKPLARDAAESARVIDAARRSDRLLGVDLSYRHLRATQAARQAVQRGELGDVYAIDLTFHNAYGPDKPWFTNRRLSGGGCLIDLGTHLVDLALWLTGAGGATVQGARVLRGGRPLASADDGDAVEDFAVAQLVTDTEVTARIACSWYLPAGRDCAIECTIYGTGGAISIRNVGGSFYDFTAHRHHGTHAELMVEPPDDWGPRAIAAWAQQLSQSPRFDPQAEQAVRVAEVLDAIYGAAA